MIIKKIKLHNIRSYLDEIIELPKGKVLLSGDIGSGKSTVLLAIEFALFGIQKGILEGASILRNGKKEGYIEVEIEVGKRKVIIRRNLKRDKNSVTQLNALLTVDGNQKKLTVTELKGFILQILNYPISILKKRGLIYRYTVYTPQEDMKRIMLENTEIRLDTLRKVFDIDKYKRILNNSEIFISELKEKQKEKKGQLIDLTFKKENLKKKIQLKIEAKKKIENLNSPLIKLQHELTNLKNELKEEQKNISVLNEVKIKIAKIETELEEKNSNIKEIEEEDEELDKMIKGLKLELSSLKKNKDLAEEKFEIEDNLKNGKDNEKILAFKINKEKFLQDLKRMSKLRFCPTCKQKVPLEHREQIISDINKQLEKIEKDVKRKEPGLLELKKDLIKLEAKLREITEREKEIAASKIRLKNLHEKETKKLKLYNMKKEIMKKISELEKIKEFEKTTFKKYKNLEEQHEKTMEILEEKQRREKKILMEKAGFEQSLKNLREEITELKDEINQKEIIAQNISELQSFQSFLEQNFSAVIELMEKQVMLKLNAEFNLLFKKWFMMLVDDSHLEVRVNPEFTPIIEQSGYEINYNYLSGGEKTALALAYRLALNQVINSMLSKINTRNLLILDEPTDGFSAEQLNKMRDVLYELKTEQLILVSHESKIESFVEHIIKFAKQGHISKIIE